jgi:hypothetical protein
LLTVHRIDLADIVSDEPEEWLADCRERGVVALAAERDGEPAGFAVAASDQQAVYVLKLEGDAGTCRLLLDRLVRFAGERDMAACEQAGRPDIVRMFQDLGFVRHGGGPCFYHWDRNANVSAHC